jgi:RHS repeat-associated protein
VQKRINGTLVQQFLYLNQLEPIAELDGAGNVVANFVYADRAHVPSLMRKASRWYRIVSDQLGSVRLVVDLSDGTIAQRLDYDEFGRVLTDTQPGFQPFGYAGGIYDRDTGLVRFGARDYDPGTGRWTAKDELRFSSGVANLFVYSSSDPINRLDLDGLAEICSRALDVLSWFPPGGRLRHDQIWYDDGSNSGFFPEGVRADLVDPNDPTSPSRDKAEYQDCRYIGPDDLVRAAETRVQENLEEYRFFTNNCQGYAESVVRDSILTDERIAPTGTVRLGDSK